MVRPAIVEPDPAGDPAAAEPAGETHLREHTVAREQLLQGHFLQVRRDTVRLPDDSHATREYVVHPGAVMIVPLLDDAEGMPRVVLERQYRHPLSQVILEFPAGKRDGTEDLLLCAQRELREETGYSAREWAHAGVMHPLVAYSDEFIDIWFARGLVAGERALDPGEFLDVTSLTLPELLQCCRDGCVTDGKTLAGALWLQNVASGAWSLDWQAGTPASAAG
jgi:ADP-ribose pyrophosphatase